MSCLRLIKTRKCWQRFRYFITRRLGRRVKPKGGKLSKRKDDTSSYLTNNVPVSKVGRRPLVRREKKVFVKAASGSTTNARKNAAISNYGTGSYSTVLHHFDQYQYSEPVFLNTFYDEMAAKFF